MFSINWKKTDSRPQKMGWEKIIPARKVGLRNKLIVFWGPLAHSGEDNARNSPRPFHHHIYWRKSSLQPSFRRRHWPHGRKQCRAPGTHGQTGHQSWSIWNGNQRSKVKNDTQTAMQQLTLLLRAIYHSSNRLSTGHFGSNFHYTRGSST